MALALLTLQTELSFRLDTWIVSEAEAADFAEQQRMKDLDQAVDILELQLKHITDQDTRNALEAELEYTRRQLAYIKCTTEPGQNPEHCVR